MCVRQAFAPQARACEVCFGHTRPRFCGGASAPPGLGRFSFYDKMLLMLLAINIGNTNIGCGIFDGKKLVKTSRMDSKGKQNYKKSLLEQTKGFSVEKIIIASVVPAHNAVFEQLCKDLFTIKLLFVHDLINDNIIKIKNRKQAGADILCNVIAAKHLYGKPSLVVDLGTATTFDAVDKDGNYVGSAIAPGMQIAHKALIEQTALLKEVALKAPKSVIGTDTTTAIQSGVVLGYVDLVEGMVKRFKKELGKNTTVIATGGLCEIANKYTKVFDHTDPHLTLRGIQILGENKRNTSTEL